MGYTPENNPYIPGDPYSYDMAWMVEEVKKAQAVGESAIDSMNAAEAWAAGTIDGVPITSDEPQYHNSAKYWADDAFVNAEQAEAWAVGTIQGIPVTSDKPQYENNSKYWADESASSASDAASSASDAASSEASAQYYADHIGDPVSGIVTDWLNDHISNPSNPPIDTSLSVSSSAADAKVTGDMIRETDGILTFTGWDNSTVSATVGAGLIRSSDLNAISINPSPQLDGFTQAFTILCPAGYVAQLVFANSLSQVVASTPYQRFIRYDVPSTAYYFNINIAKHFDDAVSTSEADDIIIIKETHAGLYENRLIQDLLLSTVKQGCYDLYNEDGRFVNGNQAPSGGGAITPSSTRLTLSHANTILVPYNQVFPDKIYISLPSTYKYRITFWNGTPTESTLIATDSNTTWQTVMGEVPIPSTAKYYKISIAKVGDASISPTDVSDFIVLYRYGVLGKNVTAEYDNKIISILGDSISTYAGPGGTPAGDGHTLADGTYTYPGNHCRYPNASVTDPSEMYWVQLLNTLNATLGINDSWAGSRISWDGTEGNDVGANKYIASPTRIGHLDDNGTPDLIIVEAGTNDIGANVTIGTFDTSDPKNLTPAQIAALPVATFADAVRALLIRLEKTYPSSKIIFMLPNYTNTYYDITNADAYCEIIKEACDFFGIPVFDCRTIGITIYNLATYLSDGIHYNPTGMALLYRKLLKCFLYQIGL